MKAQFMTKYGVGNGNCLDACIASLLEVDIDSVPNLSDTDKAWHEKTRDFLQSSGFGCLWVAEPFLKEVIITSSLCIAVMRTDSEESHAIVGRWRAWKDSEDTWRYEVTEEFDPNERKNANCTELAGVLLIFRAL